MRRKFTFLLPGLLLLVTGCSTVVFRADFTGVPNGPFSAGSTGQHQEASSPNGDLVFGSHLQSDTVQFVNGVFPDDALALMLAPNPVTATDNPEVEFRPVQAPGDDDKRTFFWQGRKAGSLALDCDFRNWTNNTNSDSLFILRFASGKVFMLSVGTFEVGSLGNNTPHNVFVTIEQGAGGATVEVSPHGGGTPISHPGIYIQDDPDDVRVTCSYSAHGNVASDNYLFDRMIFRSK